MLWWLSTVRYSRCWTRTACCSSNRPLIIGDRFWTTSPADACCWTKSALLDLSPRNQMKTSLALCEGCFHFYLPAI